MLWKCHRFFVQKQVDPWQVTMLLTAKFFASKSFEPNASQRSTPGGFPSPRLGLVGIGSWYCWWKKSCTSWYGKYPIIYKVSCMLGGAGFLPSTVVLIWKVEMYLSHSSYTASQISFILRFTTRGGIHVTELRLNPYPLRFTWWKKEGGSWCLHTPPGVTIYITNPNNALFVENPSKFTILWLLVWSPPKQGSLTSSRFPTKLPVLLPSCKPIGQADASI